MLRTIEDAPAQTSKSVTGQVQPCVDARHGLMTVAAADSVKALRSQAAHQFLAYEALLHQH